MAIFVNDNGTLRQISFLAVNDDGTLRGINQVFVNLLENAIKYGFDNTNVIVRIEQEKNKEIKVSVINNGEGIPDKYIDRLTERFFRVDKARSRKIGGTGLGLAIVKHIIDAHDENIFVQSTPKIGSEFSFTLQKKINP